MQQINHIAVSPHKLTVFYDGRTCPVEMTFETTDDRDRALRILLTPA